MTYDKDEVNRYQDRLSEELSTGGCMELAEATSEKRESSISSTRRNFTKALVSAGIILGIPGAVEASDSEDNDQTEINSETIEVRELQGQDMRYWRNKAAHEKDLRLIKQALIDDGFRPRQDQAKVIESSYEDEKGAHQDYITVIIPFILSGKGDDDKRAQIIYSTLDGLKTTGIYTEHIDVDGDGENDHYNIRRYTVSGGQVEIVAYREKNFLGCEDVNWNCVGIIAAAWSGFMASCAACASTVGGFACIACIGGGMGSIATVDMCSWCRE